MSQFYISTRSTLIQTHGEIFEVSGKGTDVISEVMNLSKGVEVKLNYKGEVIWRDKRRDAVRMLDTEFIRPVVPSDYLNPILR